MIRILPNGIPGAVVKVNRRSEQLLNELGGVRSPELRAAARTLAASIRKTLSRTGGGAVASRIRPGRTPGPKAAQGRLHVVGGTPSAPGEPPRKQTGRLARSVRVVRSGASLLVGPSRFTAAFLEEGVQSTKGKLKPSRGGKGTRQRALHARRARQRTTATKRSMVLAPRPFMRRALEAVRGKLLEVFVTEARRRI